MKSDEIRSGKAKPVEEPIEEPIEETLEESSDFDSGEAEYEPRTEWMTPGEVAGFAAMNACPEHMPEDQKYAVGKTAAFTAGYVTTSAILNGIKRICGW